jgi:membrane protein YdbS with pleckstrin-like domain
MTDDMQGTPGNGELASDDAAPIAPAGLLSRLRELPLFSRLDGQQFRWVADLLHTQKLVQGVLLFDQGGSNTRLYILRKGRAAVRMVNDKDEEKLVTFLQPGAIFNQAAFLTGARNDRSVEAVDDTQLWWISREEFLKLVELNPQVELALVYPESTDATTTTVVRPGTKKHSWQKPNETVILFRKKHTYVFINSIWPATLLTFIVIGVLLVPLRVIVQTALAPALAAVAVLYAIFIVFALIDWQNDYYAITDQRVLHRERVLMIRDEEEEVPLSKIQDIKVEHPSFMSQLYDFGSVTIESSGTASRVRFDNIARPEEVAETIFKQLDRTKLQSSAARRSKFRAELRGELKLGPKVIQPPPSRRSYKRQPAPPRPPMSTQLNNVRNTLMPRMRLEKGDTITYRRHWLKLLETIGFPAIAFFIFGVVLVAIRILNAGLTAVLFTFPVVYIVLFVGLVLFGWLVYQYEDWRNDIYILMGDRIIDIDRSPFGLTGTKRIEAKLGSIQNVNSVTRGVLDSLFNVGDVIIKTAGVEGELKFERVYDPRRIQRDITDRIDANESNNRERDAAQRRKEMTEWLSIYDELTRLHNRSKLE